MAAGFEHMEQFINDVKLGQDDLKLNYDDVIGMYQNEELAMYFGTSAMVKTFQDQGIDTAFYHSLIRMVKNGS